MKNNCATGGSDWEILVGGGETKEEMRETQERERERETIYGEVDGKRHRNERNRRKETAQES